MKNKIEPAKMGRPKIDEPKNQVGRVRLTENEMKKIKKSHKTFSAFVRAMIKTLPVAAIFFMAHNAHGFDGGLEVIKKGEHIGLGFKAEIMRIEWLESNNNTVENDATHAKTERLTQVNIAIEPDFKLFNYKFFTIEASPLLGFSHKSTKALNQNKVGAACDITGSATPSGDCFNYTTKKQAALMTGASLKFDFKADEQINFYIRGGAFSNESRINYQPQVAIGFTAPW